MIFASSESGMGSQKTLTFWEFIISFQPCSNSFLLRPTQTRSCANQSFSGRGGVLSSSGPFLDDPSESEAFRKIPRQHQRCASNVGKFPHYASANSAPSLIATEFLARYQSDSTRIV